MISVQNLKKSFTDKKRGAIRAVDGVTFHVEPGEIYGLLGLNGAGKTTTMRLLATMLAMVSMVPGFELNAVLAFIPVVNICMAMKEVILGIYQPGMIALVFLSTALYAGFALLVATRLFERESILFRT